MSIIVNGFYSRKKSDHFYQNRVHDKQDINELFYEIKVEYSKEYFLTLIKNKGTPYVFFNIFKIKLKNQYL